MPPRLAHCLWRCYFARKCRELTVRELPSDVLDRFGLQFSALAERDELSEATKRAEEHEAEWNEHAKAMGTQLTETSRTVDEAPRGVDR